MKLFGWYQQKQLPQEPSQEQAVKEQHDQKERMAENKDDSQYYYCGLCRAFVHISTFPHNHEGGSHNEALVP